MIVPNLEISSNCCKVYGNRFSQLKSWNNYKKKKTKELEYDMSNLELGAYN